MNKQEFLINAQVFYYIYNVDESIDIHFNLMDDEAKTMVIERRIECLEPLSDEEFKYMSKKTDLFRKYLDDSILLHGEELTDKQFSMISDSQRLEYYSALCEIAEEEKEYNSDYCINHSVQVWYKSYMREEQIKTVLDD
jgi:hypothetical protein